VPTSVIMTPPEDLNRVSTLMNIRVADIATVYQEWNERGAQFLTEPLHNHGAEQRCYLRDPDGYLIELGSNNTPRSHSLTATQPSLRTTVVNAGPFSPTSLLMPTAPRWSVSPLW
jgi:hypothetical protein